MPTEPEPIAGLIQEHRVIEEVVGRARDGIGDAQARPGDARLASLAIEAARDLDAFAAVDLTIHIAKEEQVLFPALRARIDAEIDTVIDDMLAQHDEVRDRNAKVRQILAAIDNHHDEVRDHTATIGDALRAAGDGVPTRETIDTLYETVKLLDWILQGHFLDEEDNVFAPATRWFTAEELSGLAAQMAAIEEAAGV